MKACDLIIVGGGAAGLLAAGEAAKQDLKVLLLEKMERPGRKLRITGKGRCNITNSAPLPEFINRFGKEGRFLRQAFHRYFTADLLGLLHSINVETVEERGGRIFPVSQEAQDVVDALSGWAKKCGATILTNQDVQELIIEEGRLGGVRTHDQEFRATKVLIATGGASYPGTGSTGQGYELARQAGHQIIPIRPALIPLITAGENAKLLQGLSLRNVRTTLWIAGKKSQELFGELIFTHFGLSGPVILSLSRYAVDALDAGQQVSISIDLKAALDDQKLDLRLQREVDEHGKQKLKSMLKRLLPAKLIPLCLELNQLDGDKQLAQVSATERKRLRHWLKDFSFDITGYRPLSEAIVTAGGVNLKEVDPKTMQSRLLDGLYFAGEVLDLQAETGGYNLQAAFSTGWLAGRSAKEDV